jgi:two-component sensor histidine kinase
MGAMLVRQEAASASAVRRELTLDLDVSGVASDIVDQVILVASELVTNAIRHCGPDVRDTLDVSWAISPDSITITVADPSDELPRMRRAAPDAPNGRGLAIVTALAEDWGAERTATGKRVWARLALR